MEIKEEEIIEALMDAFKTGQKAHQAPAYPMRIWAKEKLEEIKNAN